MTKLAAIVPALLALGSGAQASAASSSSARLGGLLTDQGDRRSLGFGVQRLQRRVNGKLQASCTGIQELRFKDAVIDNFAPIQKQRKWEGEGQRYWVNEELWGGAGYPIFVFIGGEGEESCGRLTSRMYMYELAKQHKGLLVDVEHRFYGQSYPTTDMSTENLQYLSSEQALADLARVIDYVKTSMKTQSSKVVTIGGSYPGNLAAWFKLKYPHVAVGSIASSAPLTAKTDFSEYMDVVADAMKYFSGQTCFDAFESAANAVAKLFTSGSSGIKTLEADFKTCGPIADSKDLSILLSDMMGNVQGTVQYNNEHSGVLNVTDICNTMVAGPDAYKQFVVLQEQYRAANGQECENASWKDTIAYLSNPEMDHTNAARPWVYQTCNEFGYYQTTNSKNQPFYSWTPLNLDFYRDMCYDSYGGWTSDPQVAWMNQVYGDTRIDATNVLFAAGTIDPWHALGETNSTGPLSQMSEKVVYIEGTAHCHDLYAPANSDPAALTFAREEIAKQVATWLN